MKRPDGRYDQDECRARVLRHLRDKAAGRSGNRGADLAHERALLAKEQRETAAIRNSLARGELVYVRDVRRLVEADYATVRQNFLGAPGVNSDAMASAARDATSVGAATAAVEKMLTDVIHEILQNLSDPDRVAGQAAEQQRKGRR